MEPTCIFLILLGLSGFNNAQEIMSSTILIIEDEIFIAAEMEEVIRDLGHHSAGIADDMESAMIKASNEVDIALVDVNLADGATGPIIANKLTDEFGIEVIFVTANPAQLGEGVSKAIGALEKPVDVTILKEVLDYAIAVRRGEEAIPPSRLSIFRH